MRAIWFLLAVAATLAAPNAITIQDRIAMSVENARNSLLEELLLSFINELRDLIIYGNDSIPPLDPLVVDHVVLDDEDLPIPGARVEASGVTVSNLATFVIDDLSVTLTSLILQRYRIEVDARIPSLDAVAERYDISLSAMGFNIFGSGDAKLKIINPALKINLLVSLRVSVTQGIFINLVDTKVQFNLEAFEPEITGLFNDEGASAFVNDFLRDFVPAVVVAYEADTALVNFNEATPYRFANPTAGGLVIITRRTGNKLAKGSFFSLSYFIQSRQIEVY